MLKDPPVFECVLDLHSLFPLKSPLSLFSLSDVKEILKPTPQISIVYEYQSRSAKNKLKE